DCGASNVVCDTGACVGGNCVHESDCPTAGQLCLSHQCAGCTSSGQCGSGKVCSAGLCKSGNCTSNADCAATQTCDPLTLACSACTADTQCTPGPLCLGSPGVCTVGNCRSDGDCPTAQACVGNSC